MFRKWQVYMGANDYVEMNEGLDSSMLASLGQRRRRRFLTGFCLVLALFIGAVWTASTPQAFQWLSRVAPPVAHFLRPTAGSGEESGILAQVVEVKREGDTLRVHLTMKDLQGDRLKGRTNPEHWYYEQGRIRGSGSCVPYYDDQTGLLHLNLTCQPTGDFDWDRWVTVNVYNLRTPGDAEKSQVPIPLTLTDCAQLEHSVVSGRGRLLEHLTTPVASIQEGRDITCMTVIEKELHVQVRTYLKTPVREYRLILSGPHGERLRFKSYDDGDGYTHWVFDLQDRAIADCTLSAWVDSTESIDGTWSIAFSPSS